jgi:hypothetical protein
MGIDWGLKAPALMRGGVFLWLRRIITAGGIVAAVQHNDNFAVRFFHGYYGTVGV